MIAYFALTVISYCFAKKIAAKIKSPLANPLLISVVMIICVLSYFNADYEHYFTANQLLHTLLQPAVVALAYPLYELLPQIQKRWKSLFAICLSGSILAMLSGTIIALMLGATPEIAASVVAKSVTTPIALAVTESQGGILAIAAICVVMVGLFGAIFGHPILNLMGVTERSARGLAIGTVSHALGTARCAEVDHQEAAYSSLALVLVGIMTSIVAPLLFPLLLSLMGA